MNWAWVKPKLGGLRTWVLLQWFGTQMHTLNDLFLLTDGSSLLHILHVATLCLFLFVGSSVYKRLARIFGTFWILFIQRGYHRNERERPHLHIFAVYLLTAVVDTFGSSVYWKICLPEIETSSNKNHIWCSSSSHYYFTWLLLHLKTWWLSGKI